MGRLPKVLPNGGGSSGTGWGRCGALTWHVGLWHRTLDHGKQRLSGFPVEQPQETGLGRLRHSLEILPVALHLAIDLNKLDNGSVGVGVGEINVTSAALVFEDLVIVGSAISDNHAVNMPSGFVRAFARTGAGALALEPDSREATQPDGRRQCVGTDGCRYHARHPVCADY